MGKEKREECFITKELVITGVEVYSYREENSWYSNLVQIL